MVTGREHPFPKTPITHAQEAISSNTLALTSNTIRVIVVDDHPLYSLGLRDFLSAETDIQCVGAAANGSEALQLIAHHRPDVVTLDVYLPGINGATLAQLICEQYPQVAVLALSGHSPNNAIMRMIQAGVDGYLLKSSEPEEIAHAIRVLARGESYLTPAVTTSLLQQVRGLGARTNLLSCHDDGLTDRELHVLEMLANGKTNREIADAICLSERTVENHTRSIYRKLGVHDRTQATLLAVQKGYVQLSASNP